MCTLLILLIIAGIIVLLCSGLGKRESYGGGQRECEELCYSSNYYDYCMNTCLQGTNSGWTGVPDSYESSALQAPIPLDEETGQSYYDVSAPYRYDYPGH
jgi:hypothetical protein